MAKNPNLKFLTHNSILKNSILSAAEYGEITVDLVVKNVVLVTLDEDDEQGKAIIRSLVSLSSGITMIREKLRK